MRIGVTGGRTYYKPSVVQKALWMFDKPQSTGTPVLVHGDASGADRLALYKAIDLGWDTEPHPANWHIYGNAAGPMRNQAMVDSGLDVLIAFPGGRGTADMVARALKAGVLVLEVKEDTT